MSYCKRTMQGICATMFLTKTTPGTGETHGSTSASHQPSSRSRHIAGAQAQLPQLQRRQKHPKAEVRVWETGNKRDSCQSIGCFEWSVGCQSQGGALARNRSNYIPQSHWLATDGKRPPKRTWSAVDIQTKLQQFSVKSKLNEYSSLKLTLTQTADVALTRL